MNLKAAKRGGIDEQVDDIYIKFLDLIKEYEQEVNRSKRLNYTQEQMQADFSKTSRQINTKKLEQIKYIKQLEGDIEQVSMNEQAHEIDQSLNEDVNKEIERSVDLVNKIEEKKKRVEDLARKKQQLQKILDLGNEKLQNTPIELKKLENRENDFAYFSPEFRQDQLAEATNSTRGAALSKGSLRVEKDFQALKAYQNYLTDKLEDVSNKYASKLEEEQGLYNETERLNHLANENEAELKTYLREKGGLEDRSQELNKEVKIAVKMLNKAKEMAIGKERMVGVLEQKNRRLKERLSGAEDKLRVYEELVGKNLDLKKTLRQFED